MSVYLTLGEAARQVTVTKSTLHRAINDGRLSANRDEQGHYKIDPAELFRVFEPVPRNGESNNTERTAEHHAAQSGTPAGTAESESFRWFQQQILELQEEKSELEQENKEKDERLKELRKAMAALPSPEKYAADLERLEQESRAKLEQQKKIHQQQLTQQQSEQVKAVAQQKQQAEKWKADLEKRQLEIKAARNETQLLKQQATDDIAKIERRAAGERAVREALEQRGFVARLLNRKPKMVEG